MYFDPISSPIWGVFSPIFNRFLGAFRSQSFVGKTFILGVLTQSCALCYFIFVVMGKGKLRRIKKKLQRAQDCVSILR